MLKVHIQELGSIAILCVQGRIGVGGTTTLVRAVHSQSEVKTVVLDLAQVVGIDAAGVGTLLDLREWTKARGTEFRLLNLTQSVQEVLEISCLLKVFDISSEAEVLFLTPSGRLTDIRTCNAITG